MGKQKTALIVEDSPAQALTLRRLLQEEGLNVQWASNGQIGLTMARTLRQLESRSYSLPFTRNRSR